MKVMQPRVSHSIYACASATAGVHAHTIPCPCRKREHQINNKWPNAYARPTRQGKGQACRGGSPKCKGGTRGNKAMWGSTNKIKHKTSTSQSVLQILSQMLLSQSSSPKLPEKKLNLSLVLSPKSCFLPILSAFQVPPGHSTLLLLELLSALWAVGQIGCGLGMQGQRAGVGRL